MLEYFEPALFGISVVLLLVLLYLIFSEVGVSSYTGGVAVVFCIFSGLYYVLTYFKKYSSNKGPGGGGDDDVDLSGTLKAMGGLLSSLFDDKSSQDRSYAPPPSQPEPEASNTPATTHRYAGDDEDDMYIMG